MTAWQDWRRQPHGTEAAFRRHYRLGEKPCGACTQAHRDAQNRRANPTGRTRSEGQQIRRAREAAEKRARWAA